MTLVRNLSVIGAGDSAAAGEILDRAYEILEGVDMVSLDYPKTKTPDVIGVSKVCFEASDAVTRAAHDLGIVASRELHSGGHFITSFGPLDKIPDEEDPILCMTWGQFDPDSFTMASFKEYFGQRKDLVPHLGRSLKGSEYFYGQNFSAKSVSLRQITHTAPDSPYLMHGWLNTSVEEVATGDYPVGEVSNEDFARLQAAKRLAA